jgi:hypothetical protein
LELHDKVSRYYLHFISEGVFDELDEYGKRFAIKHLVASKGGVIDDEVIRFMVKYPLDFESQSIIFDIIKHHPIKSNLFNKYIERIISSENSDIECMFLYVLAYKDDIDDDIVLSTFERIIKDPKKDLQVKSKVLATIDNYVFDHHERCISLLNVIFEQIKAVETEQERYILFEGLTDLIAIAKNDTRIDAILEKIITAPKGQFPVHFTALAIMLFIKHGKTPPIKDITMDFIKETKSVVDFLKKLNSLFSVEDDKNEERDELGSQRILDLNLVTILMADFIEYQPDLCASIFDKIIQQTPTDSFLWDQICFTLAMGCRKNIKAISLLIEKGGYQKLIGFMALDILLSGTFFSNEAILKNVKEEGIVLLNQLIIKNEEVKCPNIFDEGSQDPKTIELFVSCLAMSLRKEFLNEISENTNYNKGFTHFILEKVGEKFVFNQLRSSHTVNPMRRNFGRWLIHKGLTKTNPKNILPVLDAIGYNKYPYKNVIFFLMEKMGNPISAENFLGKYCFETDHLEYWEAAIEMVAYFSFISPEVYLKKFDFILKKPLVSDNPRLRQKIVVYLWKLSFLFQTGSEADKIQKYLRYLADGSEPISSRIAKVALREIRLSDNV